VRQFRALVVEDEPLARRMVADLLRRDREVESVVDCASAAEAKTALARERIDIAFLDIEMPGSSGLELARSFTAPGPAVVFVTAFGRYATDAFDVLAVDYVLKPFSDERFATAVGRAKTRVRERRLAELATQLATLSEELKPAGPAVERPAYLTRLSFRQDDHAVVVNVADVIWIEAEDYYVLVHTRHGRRHMVRATLASFEERLDPRRFARVHRAAIVNLLDVREVHDAGGLLLVLSDGSQVPVSRSRRRHVEPLLLPRLGQQGA
jgi:two-component system LytT family response regulator